MQKIRLPYFLWFFFGGCLIILFLNFCTSSPKNSQNQTDSSNYFWNLHDTVNYVGMSTCMTCHENVHSTFIHTGMGQSFDSASQQKSKGNFQNFKTVPNTSFRYTVYDKNRNLYYYPFWNNDSLFIEEFRVENSKKTHQRKEYISYIIGSGQHTNSHFWKDGPFLHQAPLTFYTQKGIWDLPPGFEAVNTSFERKIDMECMSCHNGMPEVNSQSINMFNKIPKGIDCERCHGPGELHVNLKRQGIIVDTSKEADRSIVNPKRLPYSRQVDICQRCHLQGNNVLKPGKLFSDFRPGMKLSDVFEVYMPKYENNDYFVMAGHSDRFQKSACFIASNPKNKLESYNAKINFTCINCHNPHVSVKATQKQVFNQTCVGCHQEESKKSNLHQCKLPIQKQIHENGCVGCHMPASGAEDIPHVMVHDHKIQRPKNSGSMTGSSGLLTSTMNPAITSGTIGKSRTSSNFNSNSTTTAGKSRTSSNFNSNSTTTAGKSRTSSNFNSNSTTTAGKSRTSSNTSPESKNSTEMSKGKLLGLYCVNNPSPNQLSEISAYLSYFEKFDPQPLYLQKAEQLIQTADFDEHVVGNLSGDIIKLEKQIHLYFLKQMYSNVIQLDGIEELTEESNQKSVDVWTYYRLAKSFDYSKKLGEALEYYQLTYQKMPLNLDFGAEYANALIRAKRLSEAKSILAKQMNMAKRHSLTWLNLGSVYYLEGNLAQAKRHFEQVIVLNPDNKTAHLYLSELYTKVGESEKSAYHLRLSK
jgi:predicted CXXCH cytochrome family protein